MVLHCERTKGGWTCRAGWDLRLRESGETPEAAFRRLCVALALDPDGFAVSCRDAAIHLYAAESRSEDHESINWGTVEASVHRSLPVTGREMLRRVLGSVFDRLRAA